MTFSAQPSGGEHAQRTPRNHHALRSAAPPAVIQKSSALHREASDSSLCLKKSKTFKGLSRETPHHH
jgi:hypothetical protein